MAVTIVTGDDSVLKVQLELDGSSFLIPGNAIVRAALRQDARLLTQPVACASGDPGADWPNSLVSVVLPRNTTWMVTPLSRPVSIEVEVDDSGDRTTWVIENEITVIKGLIE